LLTDIHAPACPIYHIFWPFCFKDTGADRFVSTLKQAGTGSLARMERCQQIRKRLANFAGFNDN
jgi:hypothetical protein